MKRTAMLAVLLLLCLGVLLAAAGCQTSGKLVSQEQSVICPSCKMETRTVAIKGVTYTKHICPSCQKVTTMDPHMEAYVGPNADQTVHVCAHCQAVVEKCPVCRKQADK